MKRKYHTTRNHRNYYDFCTPALKQASKEKKAINSRHKREYVSAINKLLNQILSKEDDNINHYRTKLINVAKIILTSTENISPGKLSQVIEDLYAGKKPTFESKPKNYKDTKRKPISAPLNSCSYIAIAGPFCKKIRIRLERLRPELVERFDRLPQNTLQAIEEALDIRTPTQRAMIKRRGINTRHTIDSCAQNLFDIMANDKTYPTLCNLPKKWRFETAVFHYTSDTINNRIRRQYINKRLRVSLLAHATKHLTEQLHCTGLSSKDVFCYYAGCLNNHPYNHYSEASQRLLSPEKLKIIKTVLSLDHVIEIATWGEAGAPSADPIFCHQHLYPANHTGNLFFTTYDINYAKSTLVGAQTNQKKKTHNGRLYMNLVPCKGPRDGLFFDPNIATATASLITEEQQIIQLKTKGVNPTKVLDEAICA